VLTGVGVSARDDPASRGLGGNGGAQGDNPSDGESGTSAAAIVDPATNQVRATLALPFDVGIPVVLDRKVRFGGYRGARPILVRAVADTPDLGHAMGGMLIETDGRHIYVPTADRVDVLVVDAVTYTVTATIHTAGSDAVASGGGAVWTVGHNDLLQRFDVKA